MAARYELSRLSLRPSRHAGVPDGAWWPADRCFAVQFARLLEQWPVSAGRIVGARYSRADWDDSPESLSVGGWRVRAAPFRRGNDRLLMVSLLGGQWRSIMIIPPATPVESAHRVLLAAADGTFRA